jgi:outer membrane protein OmpA-like peptidoglycan-associated protein
MSIMRLATVVVVAGFLSAVVAPASAQSIGDRLKRKAKERVDQATERGIDKTLDKAENVVKCAATDAACIEKAKAEGKKVDTTAVAASSGAAAQTTEAAAAAPTAAAPAMAFVNFDFVPGERLLFVEDFGKDNVGDFPRRLEFIKGNMEVAEYLGTRWLRATVDGAFGIPLPETLPEQFTVEFDHIGASYSYPHVTLHFGGDVDASGQTEYTYDVVVVQTGYGNGVKGGVFDARNAERSVGIGEDFADKPMPVRVMVDGKYAKVYLGGTRVANIPNANLGRANRLVIRYDASPDHPAYFANFRVAAGGKDLYDAIAEKGRVATQGIYFDTGSDRLRPESAPTLKEIAAMLKEHADLSLTIEGHTDNVGNAASNQSLSEKRAAAVKAALVAEYGIDATRLETAGFGASKPVAPNDTPEGRQANRRVELVKKG